MIKLFVSTFGNSCKKIKKGIIPIEVGAFNRDTKYEYRDDGDRYNQRYLAFLGKGCFLYIYLLITKNILKLKRISRILRINKNSRIYIFFSKKIKHNSSFNK